MINLKKITDKRKTDSEIAREAGFAAHDVIKNMVDRPGWERTFPHEGRKALYLDYLVKERELLSPNTIHTAESQKVNKLEFSFRCVQVLKQSPES